MPNEFLRGEIWWVSLDPTVGSEIRKRRPCVVISSDVFGHLPMRVVVPFTSWQLRFSNQPNRMRVAASALNGLTSDSGADALQIRSVDVARFASRLGVLAKEDLDEISARIAQVVEFNAEGERPRT